MRHLGVGWNLPVNKGLAFIVWNGEGEATEHHQVQKGRPYPWMTPEGFEATLEQLRHMAGASFEDMAGLMRTPLRDWFERRNLHPEAYTYLKVLAASQTAQAEPAMTPAGDFLGYMAIAGRVGMNLVTGSVATADEPGCIAIPQQFEKVVLENGGEVLRNTPVREVLIEDSRVAGVLIRSTDNEYGAERIVEADQVICTIPPKYIFSVLPRRWFPAQWVDLLERKFWGAGLLTGWCGMRRSQFPDIGIEEGSFVYMPGITEPDEGFTGVVDMVMCDFTAWGEGTARRGPEGKREYYFSTALTDEEMRNPDRVNRVIGLCEDWAPADLSPLGRRCRVGGMDPEPRGLRPVEADRRGPPRREVTPRRWPLLRRGSIRQETLGRRCRRGLAVGGHVRGRHHRKRPGEPDLSRLPPGPPRAGGVRPALPGSALRRVASSHEKPRSPRARRGPCIPLSSPSLGHRDRTTLKKPPHLAQSPARS